MAKDIDNYSDLMAQANELLDQPEDIRPLLRVVTGGHPPTPANWLLELPVGTCFVTRAKSTKMYNLDEYHVVFHGNKSTVLCHNQNGPQLYLTVDTMRFSEVMELHEVMGHTDPNQEETKNEHERNRSDLVGELEDSEDASGGC